MAKKEILVTGGAGYIGSHTCFELFLAGYTPVIIDNFSKSDSTLIEGLGRLMGEAPIFYHGDCLDKNFLTQVFQKHSLSGVIHFAAFKSVGESVQFPLTYYRNNLESLITLLDVMRQFKLTDLIFSSSCTVYGQPDQIPVGESAPFKKAESPYGATKQMAERILEDVYPTGFRVISLRYFNPIGAHPSSLIGELSIGVPNNLVPYVMQTAAGKRERLTVFGGDYNTPDGSCIRDFIHVVDVAEAHVKAFGYLADQPSQNMFDSFNLGTGIGVSVLELINEFQRVIGVNVPYIIGPRRPGDIEKVFADPSKINEAFNWRSRFSLSEGLSHSWKWELKRKQLKSE